MTNRAQRSEIERAEPISEDLLDDRDALPALERRIAGHILRYLAERGCSLDAWDGDADAARVLAGAVENHSV